MPSTRKAKLIWGLVVAFAMLMFLAPLFLMVFGSVRTPGLPPPNGFEWLPQTARWANYLDVFEIVPLAKALTNSMIVVLVSVPLTVAISSSAGFALAMERARKKRLLLTITLAALLVPASVLWVPRLVLYSAAGISDTKWSLISPALMATSPFFVLVFAFYYSRIPRSIYDMAALDGLSVFQLWRKVAFPLGRPAVFAVAVLAFAAHWNNFVEPMLYLSSSDQATASLILRSLQTQEPTMYPILLAASLIVSGPPIVGFLIAQRAFLGKAVKT